MAAQDVAHAALRGAVGAMGMTGMRTVTGNLGLLKESPPQAIFRQGTKGLIRAVPKGKRKAAQELAHWGFGAFAGAGYGAMPEGFRRLPWSGPAYGLLVWLGFEAAIAPALGIHQNRRIRPQDRAALVADHLLYGFVLDELGRQARSDPAGQAT
jgi:hypothetical protein